MSKSSKKTETMEVSAKRISKIKKYLSDTYEFRRNTVLSEPEYRKRGSNDEFVAVNDGHFANIQLNLWEYGFTNITEVLGALLRSTEFVGDFNPFQSYFDSLPTWNKDSDPDYIAQLCSFIEVDGEGTHQESQEWFRGMFTKHLMRTIACSLRWIDFNKHCFVLQSGQNDGKTSFIRHLYPEPLIKYCKENPPLDHKDSVLALSQNIIILLDELQGYSKAEANKVKSLFSQSDTKVRNHYAIKDTLQPRYASFFGTINEKEFLNDTTGNVRWLVFSLKSINHDNGGINGYKQVDINRVWSQAYSMLKQGYDCKLSRAEIDRVEQVNKSYMKITDEMDLVGRYFAPCEPTDPECKFMTSTEITQELVRVTGGALKINSVQVGKALAFCGFVRMSRWLNSSVKHGYNVKSIAI